MMAYSWNQTRKKENSNIVKNPVVLTVLPTLNSFNKTIGFYSILSHYSSENFIIFFYLKTNFNERFQKVLNS
jgi:hypothetical protein